jgi:hypothetical protein
MAVIVPINDFDIADILFEYSEEIPNDIYIKIMDLLKIYHDDNSEINFYILEEFYLNNLNEKIINKIKKKYNKIYFIVNCNCHFKYLFICIATTSLICTLILIFYLLISSGLNRSKNLSYTNLTRN